MRRIIPLLLLLLLAASLPGAATAQSAVDTVRVTQIDTSRYPDVTVYVSVHNQANQPLSGLSAAAFRVTEDGTPVDITSFSSDTQISAALVLDRSGSMDEVGKLRDAQAAARAFIARMQPADQIALIAFNSRIANIQPLTNNRQQLDRAIARLEANGGTALYDSLIGGVDALRDVPGRRVLLLLTDGQDCRELYDCPNEEGSRATLDEAIAYANEYQQPVYVVGLGDRSDARDEYRGINENVLRSIASETYGDYFYTPTGDELTALYERLAGDLQAEYALTYTSPRPFYDGTRRDIQVNVDGVTSAGVYTERHMINVQSNALVGLLLLLPLLGLLLVPSLVRRRVVASPAGAAPAGGARARRLPVDDEDETPATGPTQPEAGAAQARYCDQCGQPVRPTARFCGKCGAQQ
jgi:Ca-activated chloride channel family protein